MIDLEWGWGRGKKMKNLGGNYNLSHLGRSDAEGREMEFCWSLGRAKVSEHPCSAAWVGARAGRRQRRA